LQEVHVCIIESVVKYVASQMYLRKWNKQRSFSD